MFFLRKLTAAAIVPGLLAVLAGCEGISRPDPVENMLFQPQTGPAPETKEGAQNKPGMEQARSLMRLAADMEARGGAEEKATALSLYEQAVTVSGNDPAVTLRLAEAYEKAGRTDSALKTYRGMIAKTPSDGAAHMGLGGMLIKMGQVENGIKQLEKGALLLNSAVAFNRLGIAYTQVGKVKEARSAFESAAKLSPHDIDIGTNLALAKALDGDYEGAVALMQEINESPNAQVRHRQNLVLVLALSGRPDAARHAAQDSIPQKELDELIARAAKMRTLTEPKARAKALGTVTAG
jgi:Flp pilus assembly protein TadD